jgi:hypothetical protein
MSNRKELLRWDPPVPVEDTDNAGKRKTISITTTAVDQMSREFINSIFPPVEFSV